jgi:hypothetical protein
MSELTEKRKILQDEESKIREQIHELDELIDEENREKADELIGTCWKRHGIRGWVYFRITDIVSAAYMATASVKANLFSVGKFETSFAMNDDFPVALDGSEEQITVEEYMGLVEETIDSIRKKHGRKG